MPSFSGGGTEICMKLLIIRHGAPDYEHDSLTEKGWNEALINRPDVRAGQSSQ